MVRKAALAALRFLENTPNFSQLQVHCASWAGRCPATVEHSNDCSLVVMKHSVYRSHFGSRYKSGCCGHAGLIHFRVYLHAGFDSLLRPCCNSLRGKQLLPAHCHRWRPYRVECTGSLPTSEVKRRRARLVLGWGTAREDLRVLPAFATRTLVITLECLVVCVCVCMHVCWVCCQCCVAMLCRAVLCCVVLCCAVLCCALPCAARHCVHVVVRHEIQGCALDVTTGCVV